VGCGSAGNAVAALTKDCVVTAIDGSPTPTRQRARRKAAGGEPPLRTTIAYTGPDGVMRPATMTIGGVSVQKRMADQDVRIADRDAKIARQDVKIARQDATIADLKDRIAEIQAQVKIDVNDSPETREVKERVLRAIERKREGGEHAGTLKRKEKEIRKAHAFELADDIYAEDPSISLEALYIEIEERWKLEWPTCPEPRTLQKYMKDYKPKAQRELEAKAASARS
jgi:hypothetical protein